MKSILSVAVVLLLLGAGCEHERTPHDDEHVEVLIIGPDTRTCQGFIEQECFLEYSEEIQGFSFEPGFVYTLEVRLEDRGTDIQDVGRYAYHLVEVLSKREVSDGSYATGFVVDGERLYVGSEANSTLQ